MLLAAYASCSVLMDLKHKSFIYVFSYFILVSLILRVSTIKDESSKSIQTGENRNFHVI